MKHSASSLPPMAKLILGKATPLEVHLCMEQIDCALPADWEAVLASLVSVGWVPPPFLFLQDVMDEELGAESIDQQDLKGLRTVSVTELLFGEPLATAGAKPRRKRFSWELDRRRYRRES